MADKKTADSTSEDKLIFSYVLGEEVMMQPEYSRYYQAMNNIQADLVHLNVNRGGSIEGNAGFVFEDMHAASSNIDNLAARNGKVVDVLGNNDMQHDLIVTSRDKNISYQQVKSGYHGSNKYKITKEHYSDDTIVIDKGNTELEAYLEKNEMRYQKSKIRSEDSVKYAKTARKENEAENFVQGKIKKKSTANNAKSPTKNAPVVATIKSLEYHAKAANAAGLAAGKSAAAFAGGFSFGKNMYQFMDGDITLGEAVTDTVKDTLKGFVAGYLSGTISYAAGAIISQTAITGMIAGSAAGSVFVSIGGVVATMSAAMWPVFVAGMVIGTGYSMFQGIKYKTEKYKNQISQINSVLESAINIIQATYNELDETIKRTYCIWDETMDKGFAGMLKGVRENDFTMFSDSLNKILELYHSQVLFRSMEEFEEFFYDDNAVLTL